VGHVKLSAGIEGIETIYYSLGDRRTMSRTHRADRGAHVPSWPTEAYSGVRGHDRATQKVLEGMTVIDRQTDTQTMCPLYDDACVQVTMVDRSAAERICKDPNPIIDGRKANVNLAYLGAKPRIQATELLGTRIIFTATHSVMLTRPEHSRSRPIDQTRV